MRNPKISIVIPVYNVEKYVHAALESIQQQSYQNWEAIIIDDGSTDHSKEIIDEFIKKDPRFIVIGQKNSGVSAARNAGLKHVNGEYIMFFDPDDILHHRAIELAYESSQKEKCQIVILGIQKFFKNTKLSESLPEIIPVKSIRVKSNFFSLLFNENHSSKYCRGGYSCAKLFKSDVLANCFFNPKLSVYEDDAFCSQIYQKLDEQLSVAYIDYPLYYYRQRQSSAIRSNRIKRLFALYSCRRNISKQFSKNSPEFKILELTRLTTLMKLMQVSLLSGYRGGYRTLRKILFSRHELPFSKRLPYLLGSSIAQTYSLYRLTKAEKKNKKLEYWE